MRQAATEIPEPPKNPKVRMTEFTRRVTDARQRFEREEKPVFDTIIAHYNGDPWLASEQGIATPSSIGVPAKLLESEMMKSSINFVFAIEETGRTALVPDALAVTAKSVKTVGHDPFALAKERLVNRDIDNTALVEEMSRAVSDAVLFGRWAFKVGWDTGENTPYCRLVDINALYFDLEAKRPADIRWWAEVVPLTEKEFMDRVEAGTYPAWAKKITAKEYPTSLRRMNEDPSEYVGTGGGEVWYSIVEYYDVARGKVYHFIEGNDNALLEDNLAYVPYILGNFNDNKKNCRGLSEIMLILSNNIELNVLSSYETELVRTTIPGMLANSAAVDMDDLEQSINSSMNEITSIKVREGHTLANAIMPKPQAQAPTSLEPLMARKYNSILTVSALAEAQRGQITGAKTATDVAMMDAHIKNRLKSRDGRLRRSIAKVVEMYWYLRVLYDNEPVEVELPDGAVQVPIEEFPKSDLQLLPYTPTATNRQVIKETWQALYQILRGDQNINQMRLTEEFLKALEIPADLLAPPPPAAPATPPGGMPGGEVPPGGGGGQIPADVSQNAIPVAEPTPGTEGPVVPSPGTVNPQAPFQN